MKKVIACLCIVYVLLGAEQVVDILAQECVKRYYPQVVRIADNQVVLNDGSSFVWDDGLEKSYDEQILNPDMNDAFTYPYPLKGYVLNRNEDTSRIRHLGFYKAIYGHSEEDVSAHLVKLPWFKQRFDKSFIVVTTANGVDKAFERVMHKLENLPQAYYQFLSDQDAFYWRNIADSPNLSPHSFGIALDINTQFSKYWLWDKKERNEYQYENQIPLEIVQAFEEEGFIWGGRWWHYDTMHFEYRPEIICYAKNIQKY
ncbi:M15 family metallopeptidase [Helicobacter sp. MIT 03-1614]|uniref:M15 family metallopeptidase n=1 Tax=Helicobacter sp. MIT 03-1614 TaxID=1548147 RepID=UPI000AEB4080|nr:M15 family metallopeptidase [Helicobacter sp. MIT 03-1614]